VEPGGVDAGAVDVPIATLDESTPFVPSFSGTVAAVLNGLAQVVNRYKLRRELRDARLASVQPYLQNLRKRIPLCPIFSKLPLDEQD